MKLQFQRTVSCQINDLGGYRLASNTHTVCTCTTIWRKGSYDTAAFPNSNNGILLLYALIENTFLRLTR